MPWKETDVRSERIRFVVEAVQGHETMQGLCARYGVSRKTGYKWLRRWEALGSLGALDEQSRRPHRSPRQTDEAIGSSGVGAWCRRGSVTGLRCVDLSDLGRWNWCRWTSRVRTSFRMARSACP